MKKVLLILIVIFSYSFLCFAQNNNTELGQKFLFDFKTLNQQKSNLRSAGVFSIQLPVEGEYRTFLLKENTLSGNSETISTYDGKTDSGRYRIKLSIFPDHIEGIISTPISGYYVFEPVDIEDGIYRIYNLSEVPRENGECRENDFLPAAVPESQSNLRATQADVFPFGSSLRVFRMAAAATGEMTTIYGSKAAAIAQIISITHSLNMIYEQELAISFSLIGKTTDGTIIWDDPATDPFTPPGGGGASAVASQDGFTIMSTGALSYSEYDVGHTFHTLSGSGGGYSISGEAGPIPCNDTYKALGWTQWTYGAPLGAIVNIIAHEVGHQFSAMHTYNSTSTSFCANGWSDGNAVEPGGGSTIMGYNSNCTGQTLTGDYNLSYFHYKSIETIQNYLATTAKCYTLQSTGNTPPVANAGTDITIPKSTPFWLNGTASDADGNLLTYTWEQNDAALSTNKGALGTMLGTGGISAINSTDGPLFRSEKSLNTDRTFPKLKFILNNANQPNDIEGEALPGVARTMKFRFTVRDGYDGVNSAGITVTVADVGPLAVTYPNGSESLNANSSVTAKWTNTTSSLSPTVDVLLSVDGGMTFPYVLAKNTTNNGSANVTIPNVPGTTQARIKVVAVLNANANFFDISDGNFTINSSCQTYGSMPCFGSDVEAMEGSAALNLNLSAALPAQVQNMLVMNVGAAANGYLYYWNTSRTACDDKGINPGSGSYFTNIRLSPAYKFRVAKTGNYIITNQSSNALILTLFNSETRSCLTFISSTASWSSTTPGQYDYSYSYSMTVSLDECTDYYLYGNAGSDLSGTNISIAGPGDVYSESTPPAGTDYTYIAVSKSDNVIKAVSPTGDFTTLAAGDYRIYGVSYPTSAASSIKGNTLSYIQSTFCAVASMNFINMTVLGTSPIIITWTPLLSSTDWNTTNNWDPHKIPTITDDVIIPKRTSYPILQASDNATVNSITFAPGAELGRQDLLTYNKAFVQLDFSKGSTRDRWWMLTSPLQQLFAGDFSFGGLPGMDFKAFAKGSNSKTAWVSFSEGIAKEFGAGENFEIWLSSTDLDISNSSIIKGLNASNPKGIITLPYFEDPNEKNVHYTQIYTDNNDGTGTSTFYGKTNTFERTTNIVGLVTRILSKANRLTDLDVNHEFKKSFDFVPGLQGQACYAAMGNPFMSSINFNQLQIDNNFISESYWIWVGPGAESGGGYACYNTTAGLAGNTVLLDLDQYISPMQSFIVEMQTQTETNKVITFNIDNINATGQNANAGLRAAAQSKDLLEIIASTPQSAVRAAIASRKDGSTIFNRKDAHKLFAGINDLPDVYLLKPDANNNAVAVGADILNEIKEDVVIPLGISTTYEGSITLSFAGMDAYNARIFLIDNSTPDKKEIELTGKAKYEYTFDYQPEKVNGTAVSNESRFSIRLSPANVTGIESVTPNNILVYSRSTGTIQAVSGELIQQMSVFDIQGRIINDNTSVNSYEYAVTNLVTGVYIVKVVTKNEVKTVKIVVR